jgi:hypothetical protein
MLDTMDTSLELTYANGKDNNGERKGKIPVFEC